MNIKQWNDLSQFRQVRKFRDLRKSLGLTQQELGDKLKPYGYKGGKSTIKSWEGGRSRVPYLVYNLIGGLDLVDELEKLVERAYYEAAGISDDIFNEDESEERTDNLWNQSNSRRLLYGERE